MWLCICKCGNKSVVGSHNLKSGKTKSCGCYKRERLIASAKVKFTKHGHTVSDRHSPEYHSWQAMKTRCLNPNATSYGDYGGRGIKVCKRWMKFENFYADMGDRPEGTTIHRIKGNGNYTPSNCVWATREEQNKHKRAPRQKVA